jgi:hypothetical protein
VELGDLLLLLCHNGQQGAKCMPHEGVVAAHSLVRDSG